MIRERRKISQLIDPELLQEKCGRAVEDCLARPRSIPDAGYKATPLQCSQGVLGVHDPNLADLAPRDGLAIRNDGKRLQCGGRQLRGAFGGGEPLEVWTGIRVAVHAPAPGDLTQHYSAVGFPQVVL